MAFYESRKDKPATVTGTLFHSSAPGVPPYPGAHRRKGDLKRSDGPPRGGPPDAVDLVSPATRRAHGRAAGPGWRRRSTSTCPRLLAARRRPIERPTKPPSTAPTMPSSIVTMMPPGSFPGIRSLAIAPTTRPKTIHPRIPISHLRSPKDDAHHVPTWTAEWWPVRFAGFTPEFERKPQRSSDLDHRHPQSRCRHEA